MPLSVIRMSTSSSGQNTQFGARIELAAVGQHHQLFGLAQQFLLGLYQYRVGLHYTVCTDGRRAHEHAPTVVTLYQVLVEGADDDVLLAIQAPRRAA